MIFWREKERGARPLQVNLNDLSTKKLSFQLICIYFCLCLHFIRKRKSMLNDCLVAAVFASLPSSKRTESLCVVINIPNVNDRIWYHFGSFGLINKMLYSLNSFTRSTLATVHSLLMNSSILSIHETHHLAFLYHQSIEAIQPFIHMVISDLLICRQKAPIIINKSIQNERFAVCSQSVWTLSIYGNSNRLNI